jgi:hypothetical protein
VAAAPGRSTTYGTPARPSSHRAPRRPRPRPADKELLRTGFERLSGQSRYARFFTPRTALSDDELRYLTEVDQEDHVAIGAASERDGEQSGLGVAGSNVSDRLGADGACSLRRPLRRRCGRVPRCELVARRTEGREPPRDAALRFSSPLPVNV